MIDLWQIRDINTLAPLESPSFTGAPKSPTPTQSETDTTRVATVGFVRTAVAAGGGGGASSDFSADDVVTFYNQELTASSNREYSLVFSSDTARNYALVTIASGLKNLILALDAEVACENYILIDNSSNSNDVVVSLSALNYSGTSVTKAVVPSDGITVPANGYIELSYVIFDGNTCIGVVLSLGTARRISI